MKRLLLEGLLVAAVGAAVAFAANALSPRGLKLTRDYFPKVALVTTNSTSTNALAGNVATNSAAATLELLKARLRALGLSLADSNQVVQLYHDPRQQQDLVVFVDARDPEHYQAGHIPGAYQLDYYRPENYLPVVLPVCQIAQQIIVYCNGGNCEDSEFAANLLLSASIPKDKLLVYTGGFTEWTNNRLPWEIGERRSGNLKQY